MTWKLWTQGRLALPDGTLLRWGQWQEAEGQLPVGIAFYRYANGYTEIRTEKGRVL